MPEDNENRICGGKIVKGIAPIPPQLVNTYYCKKCGDHSNGELYYRRDGKCKNILTYREFPNPNASGWYHFELMEWWKADGSY